MFFHRKNTLKCTDVSLLHNSVTHACGGEVSRGKKKKAFFLSGPENPTKTGPELKSGSCSHDVKAVLRICATKSESLVMF